MIRMSRQANVDFLETALQRTGRSVTIYRYLGTGHWFFEPDRTQAFDPGSSQPGLGPYAGIPEPIFNQIRQRKPGLCLLV